MTASWSINSGSPQSWVVYTTTGHSASDTYLVGDQVASAVTSSGMYSWQLQVVKNNNSPFFQQAINVKKIEQYMIESMPTHYGHLQRLKPKRRPERLSRAQSLIVSEAYFWLNEEVTL